MSLNFNGSTVEKTVFNGETNIRAIQFNNSAAWSQPMKFFYNEGLGKIMSLGRHRGTLSEPSAPSNEGIFYTNHSPTNNYDFPTVYFRR